MTSANHIPSNIRDNHARGSVGDFLREQLQNGADLDIVTAYFTIFAYDKLKTRLDGLDKVRLLFGEPAFIKNVDTGCQNWAPYILDDDALKLPSGLNQRHVAQACAEWIREKVEIRSVTRAGFLHGKMSHVRRGERSAAIVGSSNFTTRGLGLCAANNNVELNLIVDGDRDRDDLRQWFEELWNDAARVEDVKQTVLDYLTQISCDQSPEFVYFKTLFELFNNSIVAGRELEESLRRIKLFDTEIWKSLYEFQRDGAKSAINKLNAFSGCILADSVGLGKTYEALAVIKYFELRNEKVLVLCPSKLRGNWDVYPAYNADKHNQLAADRFGYAVRAHTDLSRERERDAFNWGAFDLVVIDESHNFRNNSTGNPGADGAPRRTRYQRLMDDIIQSGVRTKVLLLSATPVNNTLADLRNQLSFIAGGDVARDTAQAADADGFFSEKLGIKSLKSTINAAQKRFAEWAKKPAGQRDKKELVSVLGGGFIKLLDALTIARSRHHIERQYEFEKDKLGGFPKRFKAEPVFPKIDIDGKIPSYDAIAGKLQAYELWVFRPAELLRADLPPETLAKYTRRVGKFQQKGNARILASLMRVMLLKRLESSVDSFRSSLERILERLCKLELLISQFEQHQEADPDFDLEAFCPAETDEDDDVEISDALDIWKKGVFKMAHLDLPVWKERLAEDRRNLEDLLNTIKPVTPERDAKLGDLRLLLSEKIKNPPLDKDGKPNRKVLVFTAYADTARYLYDNLHDWLAKELGAHSALVTGGGDNKSTLSARADFGGILANFAPRSKNRGGDPAAPQVDVLIASDCISEGQNLQDCDTVINYDIHWNPVRIIQRFGRIDRIGSRAKAVKLIIFWPTPNLDKYINLKHRVEARMALVDLAATQTDNPLDAERFEDMIDSEFRIRAQQLERMKTEVLDLEQLDETVALTDFSLEEFRADLARLSDEKRKQLETAPNGLYAVAPASNKNPLTAGGGMIFCLKQKIAETAETPNAADNSAAAAAAVPETEKVNPLSPHYLLYVRTDGKVHFAYTQIKSALNLFRSLALGKDKPCAELCRLFDRGTDNGKDMSHPNRLIKAAIQSITKTFQQQLASGLTSSRHFILPTTSAQPRANETEFELVTWLVLQPPKE